MNIKQVFFNRFLRRQPSRLVNFPKWKQVKSVMVVYESEWQERNTEIRAIIQQLHEQDKQVVSWGYLKKDKILSPILPESRIVGPKDFNLIGRPKNELQQSLERLKVDVLIDLSTQSILAMEYIDVIAPAAFKIGIRPASCFDMVVQQKEGADVGYSFQQIIHYLTTIKSVD